MTKAFSGVDVFVCQIQTTGKTNRSIDNHHFPVVTIVQPQRHDGNKSVEHLALDSFGAQNTVIIPGKGKHAAHIIIEYPYIDAFCSLFFQYGEDAVPKNTRLDDKVFQKDIALGFVQFFQHSGEDCVA